MNDPQYAYRGINGSNLAASICESKASDRTGLVRDSTDHLHPISDRRGSPFMRVRESGVVDLGNAQCQLDQSTRLIPKSVVSPRDRINLAALFTMRNGDEGDKTVGTRRQSCDVSTTTRSQGLRLAALELLDQVVPSRKCNRSCSVSQQSLSEKVWVASYSFKGESLALDGGLVSKSAARGRPQRALAQKRWIHSPIGHPRLGWLPIDLCLAEARLELVTSEIDLLQGFQRTTRIAGLPSCPANGLRLPVAQNPEPIDLPWKNRLKDP
ncbi:hypothetical protein IE81DRAFT_339798 [Ceraceosorus guamensis]|uniref:Uncharacterized protein n=1 Tax=Ceraceosorus guamensis TaxID=1522189 RepID=A0A316WAB0_9BASI|nr:hypothetical protein IE81DRAFT_339798 [Ceraceosorus guamensis]PWN44903.1 hypothetical protein IE81DRAFT_339798 [Ceraceosorus guamensis]